MPNNLISIPLPVTGGFIPPGGGFGASRAKQSGNATIVHNGLDLAVAIGTGIYAPLDGTVVILNTTARGGMQMQLIHANGYTTGYAHLSSIVAINGATVTAGTLIAYSGDTGDAAGHPHLHFTLRVNGTLVDPYPYLFNSNAQIVNNASVQYTPESTVTPKGKDYSQVIVVDSQYVNTLSAFIAKYNITMTPSDLLAYKNNAANILNAYTNVQKVANNNQANVNLINVGTKIQVPLWQMKLNNPYRINQNLLIGLDYTTFLEAEIKKLINDPQYKRLTLIGSDGNAAEGTVYKKINQVSIWLWSRAVSPNGRYLVDLSPFIKSVNINVTKDGGNFTIEVPHISFNQVQTDYESQSTTSLSANVNLTPAQLSDLFQLPIININKSTSEFNYSSFVSKGSSHTIQKINKSNYNLSPPSKDDDISSDPNYFSRNNSLFHHIVQPNDLLFIRLEKLEIDSSAYTDVKEGYAIVNSSALSGKVFDMIGLVDSAPITLDGTANKQSVTIQGRDLSKLLLDDGVFFFPVQYAIQNPEQIVKNSTKTKSGGRVFVTLPPIGNAYSNNLTYNASGNIISTSQFFFDIAKPISDWLLFIFQQLTHIQICPNGLFSSYKDKTFIVSSTDNFATDGSFGYQRILADGIWQIVKLVLDPNISQRFVADASLSTDTGSLLNLVRKVCQSPFAEFTTDTYGDKFYFILRKPPFVSDSYKTNKIINIFEYDVLQNTLEFNQEFYTWFRLTPMGSVVDTSDGNMMIQLPAVMLPEYVDVWGTKILDVQSNFLDYYYSEGEETANITSDLQQQAEEDFDWLIESHAYLPFTRVGTLTIKANRTIKRGMCIRFFPTGEVYHVDAVNNTRSFNSSVTQATTTLQLSHGIVEKHFDKYFSIVNLKKNGTSKDTWTVNRDLFNFFLYKQQFLT